MFPYSFKYILKGLNQYLDAGKKIDINTGKIKGYGICKKKEVQNHILDGPTTPTYSIK